MKTQLDHATLTNEAELEMRTRQLTKARVRCLVAEASVVLEELDEHVENFSAHAAHAPSSCFSDEDIINWEDFVAALRKELTAMTRSNRDELVEELPTPKEHFDVEMSKIDRVL